jgi:glucosamine-phosphate N-acetyltransferase
MKSRPGEYFVIVIEELAPTRRIVASGSILVEQKFIRKCGKVGHIEDIVVHESQRGKNFGRKYYIHIPFICNLKLHRIIDQLTHLGKQAGCYKIILCCEERNIGFYEKCGYAKKEVEMVLYFNK